MSTPILITPSEEKVMLLFWKGHTRHEVAERLHRSPTTIQTHERNIFVKIGAKNKADMFRYMETHMYHINTAPIRQRIRAILCIVLVLGIELGGLPVLRAKNGSTARAVRAKRARRDQYNQDKTFLYVA